MSEGAGSEVLVRVEVADGVGTLTLQRPRQLNAFSLELAAQFLAGAARFAADPDVRVVVLRGAGRAFSAGGDVGVMLETVNSGNDPAAYFEAPLAAFHEMVAALVAMPKPVLAAVHGAVAGIAFNVMLACDLRLAAAGTRFTQAFCVLGLSPDGGGTWALPRLVGHARACELAMLPTTLDATRAREWGLINWVVPAERFDEEVARRAAELAAAPTAALARTKRLLWEAHGRDLGGQLDAERVAQVANAGTEDFIEGVRAFAGKRPADFVGR